MDQVREISYWVLSFQCITLLSWREPFQTNKLIRLSFNRMKQDESGRCCVLQTFPEDSKWRWCCPANCWLWTLDATLIRLWMVSLGNSWIWGFGCGAIIQSPDKSFSLFLVVAAGIIPQCEFQHTQANPCPLEIVPTFCSLGSSKITLFLAKAYDQPCPILSHYISMKSWQLFDSFVWFVFVIRTFLANSVPNKLGKRWVLALHFNHSVLDDISIKAWNMQNCQMAFSLLSSGIASISLWKMCALSENGILYWHVWKLLL